MQNPILARVEKVREEGLHPMHIRVSANGRGKWKLTIVFDDGAHPHELADPNFSIKVPKQSELPDGVRGHFWQRWPDDESELSGSSEAVETWIAEAARVGKAIDWARYDGDGPGYPSYLTKPSVWLRETNPFHPDNPRNPANKFPDFASRLTALIDATGLSVNAFCEKHNLSQSSVQSYVAGKSRPTWDKVQELAKALGVSTDVFRDK
jgi:hypothetical protein